VELVQVADILQELEGPRPDPRGEESLG
jgi:hypothetical protein